jgi:uncharacterized membrane protein
LRDEVGLLLTFGNYYSELTYVFAIVFIAVALLGLLLSSYKDRLKDDVTEIGTNERVLHIGVIIAGLSIAAFSVSAFLEGFIILVIGVVIAVAGVLRLSAREGSSHR